MKALKMYLEGFLQSWSDSPFLEKRETNKYPTSSGIVGLITAAFGYPRGDKRIEELSNQLDLYAERFTFKDAESRYGGITMDFQTIKDPLPRADGKDPKKAPPMEKYYLTDTCNVVYVVAEEELLEKIGYALIHPKFHLYLGRKCCTPSRRIYGGIVDFNFTEEQFICI